MKFGFGIFALLLKIGPKIFALFIKLLKGLKVGKIGLAGASMATYSYMYTWQFALMIMAMLFIHESGHIWAMKRFGIKTKGIYFIPFFGGAAVSDKEFPSRGAESYIALMGPLWGLAATLATALLYVATKNPLWAAGAGWMAVCNLFNLLPINPLDGGRVLKSIAFSFHSVLGFISLAFGLLACLALAVYAGFGLFFILLPIGVIELSAEVFDLMGRKKKQRMVRKQILWLEKRISSTDKSLKETIAFSKAYPDIDDLGALGHDDFIENLKHKKELAEKQLLEGEEFLSVLSKDAGETRPMNRWQMFLSVAGYMGIGVVLWILMTMMHYVPEVEAAMNFLKG